MPVDQSQAASVLIEQAFARASGAPLVTGNDVRLLRDASENYPAWLEAIAAARRTIHFESYIIHDDETGQEFAQALAARARVGVCVRVVYDWLGAVGKTSKSFWRALRDSGVEVRCFNPPRLAGAITWLSRDHRKMLAVDGQVAFVTGLCVGRDWVGDPARGVAPWRDTGIALRGPAVADLERAFASMWALAGPPVVAAELPVKESLAIAGDIAVRVIASTPGTAGLYRLDQLIATAARRTLWLTDAYFVGTTAYVQSLRAAARDGVDVRLLVPGATISGSCAACRGRATGLSSRPACVSTSGTGPCSTPRRRWRTGVGARGFHEPEPAVLARQLGAGRRGGGRGLRGSDGEDVSRRPRPCHRDHLDRARPPGEDRGDVAAARRPASWQRRARGRRGVVSIGSAVGAAMTGHRVLGPAEARVTGTAGLALLVLALLALIWPRVIAVPLAAIAMWVAVSLLIRARALRRERTRQLGQPPGAGRVRGRRRRRGEGSA